ncbi:MAG: HpcH/HpaI aldolase/citrate lyase family protein [Acidimicrobiales bacterium]
MAPGRLRRSELSTPASSTRMIEKAAGSSADFVFLDLEDSVASSAKAEARRNAVTALRELDWHGKTRAVRVNGCDTEWALEDVTEVVLGAGECLDVIIVPKVKAPRDLWWVETVLSQLEPRGPRRDRPVGLEALIEEVEALQSVDEIARCSPRLEALIFGPGDLAASQGVRVANMAAYGPSLWDYARSRIVVATRAAGIAAVDGPFWGPIADLTGYAAECDRASILGFEGKWAIHPSQIDVANERFSPTADEVAGGRRVVEAFQQAAKDGVGAISLDGNMVDVADLRICTAVVERAEAITEWENRRG